MDMGKRQTADGSQDDMSITDVGVRVCAERWAGMMECRASCRGWRSPYEPVELVDDGGMVDGGME